VLAECEAEVGCGNGIQVGVGAEYAERAQAIPVAQQAPQARCLVVGFMP